MANIIEAFCTELGTKITAEEAYQYYQAGLIKNNRSFECIGKNCSGKVTCANMYVDEANFKQAPHFRGYHHSEDCDYIKFLEKQSSKTCGTTGSQTQVKDIREFFYVARPVSGVGRKEGGKEAKPLTKSQYIASTNGNSDYNVHRRYYSIGPIVDNFFKYREEKTAKEIKLTIGDLNISYFSLFRNFHVKGLDWSKHNDTSIFWGSAYINEYSSGYQIRFTSKINYGEHEDKPAFFIYNQDLKNYKLKERFNKYIKLGLDKKQLLVFVFGKIVLKTKGERIFVNTDFLSLDHIEFKTQDYLGRLK